MVIVFTFSVVMAVVDRIMYISKYDKKTKYRECDLEKAYKQTEEFWKNKDN